MVPVAPPPRAQVELPPLLVLRTPEEEVAVVQVVTQVVTHTPEEMEDSTVPVPVEVVP